MSLLFCLWNLCTLGNSYRNSASTWRRQAPLFTRNEDTNKA